MNYAYIDPGTGGAVFGMKPCTFDSKDGGTSDVRFGMIRLDVKAAAH